MDENDSFFIQVPDIWMKIAHFSSVHNLSIRRRITKCYTISESQRKVLQRKLLNNPKKHSYKKSTLWVQKSTLSYIFQMAILVGLFFTPLSLEPFKMGGRYLRILQIHSSRKVSLQKSTFSKSHIFLVLAPNKNPKAPLP